MSWICSRIQDLGPEFQIQDPQIQDPNPGPSNPHSLSQFARFRKVNVLLNLCTLGHKERTNPLRVPGPTASSTRRSTTCTHLKKCFTHHEQQIHTGSHYQILPPRGAIWHPTRRRLREIWQTGFGRAICAHNLVAFGGKSLLAQQSNF